MIFNYLARLAFTIGILLSILSAQVLVPQVKIIDTGSRGYINNPAWSLDSKLLAFEFKPQNASTLIMILDVNQGISAVNLFAKPTSTSSLLVSIDKESMRLPQWSHLRANTLYILHSGNRPRLLSKIEQISTKKIPLNTSSIKHLDKTIKQESQIVEYYPVKINAAEYIFAKQQNTPDMIEFTDLFGILAKLSGLKMYVDGSELIDSFSFSKLSPKFLLCKGQDNQKQIIMGKMKIHKGQLESVDYEIIKVDKSSSSALQEPSFSPFSDHLLAYLEVSKNLQGMASYDLKIYSRNNHESYQITNSIYRNEENKTSQPLSTSYAWHTIENYIFFIDKLSNRSIHYADYTDLENIIVKELPIELEFVENLCVSPDGKYLTAITSSNSAPGSEDALNQMHLIMLDTK